MREACIVHATRSADGAHPAAPKELQARFCEGSQIARHRRPERALERDHAATSACEKLLCGEHIYRTFGFARLLAVRILVMGNVATPYCEAGDMVDQEQVIGDLPDLGGARKTYIATAAPPAQRKSVRED